MAVWVARARLDATIRSMLKIANGEWETSADLQRLQSVQLTQFDVQRIIDSLEDRVGTPRRTQVEELGTRIPPMMLMLEGAVPPYMKAQEDVERQSG
jgi:hypothetical protein